jgi:Na+/H+ antiporter NhaD/arsenite permease-like protein
VLAGLMGTTGVSMVLIHPLLRANQHRTRKVHLVVFFILLVSNVGGATTPLGDPPLYIGFLQGIPFFWPLQYLSLKTMTVAVPLLALFWLVDRHFAKTDAEPVPRQKLQLDGRVNILLLALVVTGVLVQGMWQPGAVVLFGTAIGVERLVAMGFFLVLVGVSLKLTPRAVREGNLFTWAPMVEVAVLFLAIFITIAPVLQMLGAGREGPMAGLLALTSDAAGHPSPAAYFWLTGILSAFLDNAPTWLVFFQTAGGDVARLTGEDARVLQAISAGAVFFGALTYIGNAPNLMVRTIAAHRGVRMPGFFGYFGLACLLLLPLFALVTVLFFI